MRLFEGKGWPNGRRRQPRRPRPQIPPRDTDEVVFWDRIHAIEATFHAGLELHEAKHTSGALLELDRTIWEAHQNLESDQLISEARENIA